MPPTRLLSHGVVVVVGCVLALAFALAPAGVRAERSFRTAPYLLDPQPTSVVLMFELDAARAAEIRLVGSAGERVLQSPAVAHHLVRLEGLEADQAYTYSVRVPGVDRPAARGTFRTPRNHDRSDARICVYGDSRSGEAEHRHIVAALRRSLSREPADAVVHLGDFVAQGGKRAEWRAPFESIAPLIRDVPYLFALGNHELLPDDTGRPLYERFLGRAFGEQAYYVRRFGPLHVVVLDTNTAWPDDADQITWARQQLVALRAAHPDDFILLIAHHPMFSSALHEDHLPLRDALEVTARANSDLVLGGHDHTYERGTVAGLNYIVSGGGGSPLYAINHHRAGQLAFLPEHHFLCLAVDAGQLTLTATRRDGSVMERCSLRRGGPFVCADGTPNGVIRGQSPFRFWLTSGFLWRRLGPALGLLALVVWATRKLVVRHRQRRRTDDRAT